MKTAESIVKSGGKEVSKCTYKVYDTIEEAIADLGTEKALEYINSLSKTNAQNEERAKFNKKPTKEQLNAQAQAELQALPTDQQIQVLQTGLTQWLAAKVAELENKWEADKEARIAALKADDEAQAGQEEQNA